MLNKNRIFGLDVLRSIAILTVVYGHVFYILPNNVNSQTVRLFFFDGVNIFFTLSGYFIGSILLKGLASKPATWHNLLQFWENRWWRTLPAYFFILLLLIISDVSVNNSKLSHFVPYLFFAQNIRNGQFSPFNESWSLSVEEWFYLTTPVIMFLSVRFLSLKKAVPVIVSCVFLLATAIRIYKMRYHGIFTYEWYVHGIAMTVPTRIDAVMFGVLGAYLNFYNFKIWTNYRNQLFWIGVIGFFINHFYGVYAGINNYIVYFHKQVELLLVLMVIPKLSIIKTGKGIFDKIITFIALISYSIYLVHGSVFNAFLSPLLPENFWIQLPFYLVWAFAAAYLLYISVEKWGMRQREKFNKKNKMRLQSKLV